MNNRFAFGFNLRKNAFVGAYRNLSQKKLDEVAPLSQLQEQILAA
ncbi:hypothetical protein [Leptospira santarosai]|nr:hypothetical protein [Leptospira santarosai]